MNGTLIQEGSNVDHRPIISCAGEIEVFSTIEDSLSEALPQDSCDWRRSLGRPVRAVRIGATFAPYSPVALPKGNQWDLIRQPLFHIYWTECSDVDVYKNSLKEDIENWLKELSSRDIIDWLIIVVENFDGKRTNKLLPRTTVLDKIRADFAPKQGDRCISVINPGKTESRSADSWRGLVSRVRHLLLVAYAKAVTRLEEHVRQQRERRNEIGWDFIQYFHLQEELAQVLEMLGLYEEALVQYDELDALFSQFVVNGITSESVSWLGKFQKPLEKWHGLKLDSAELSKEPSVLELRAYLLAKQSYMLLLTNKVWDMASRCLPYLHICLKELNILEISAPPGAVACWLFLAVVEVLQTCDRYNHADAVEEYSLHTAGLWEYASQKLHSLGELCGLLPGGSPTSEQLHIVVGLSAGMGDNPGMLNSPSPTDKLKEALCSQDVFNKTYLELAELAMGTYKHIGRIRSARLVGREVAFFYMLLGETQKAAAFLSDALRTFENDGWHELTAQTQLELAECFKKAKDFRRLVSASAGVSAALEMDTLVRWTYFDEMRKCVDSLTEPLVVPFGDVLRIISVGVKNEGAVMQDNDINVELVLESNFPREIMCTNLLVSLEVDSGTEGKKPSERYCKTRLLTSKDLKQHDPMLQRLRMKKNLDYKQDKQLAVAGIVSQFQDLKRKDSSPAQAQANFSHFLEVSNLPLLLTPGLNLIRLKKQANRTGKYYLGQVAVHVKNLQMMSPSLTPRLAVEVKEEGPTLKLYKRAAPLLTGIEQIMNLIITIGSYSVDPTSKIKLTASPGLALQVEKDKPLSNALEIGVGKNFPFTSTRRHLRVLADMLSKDNQVTICCPWASKPMVVTLNFSPPLTALWKLHTVVQRKLIQVSITGQCDRDFLVEQAKLTLTDALTVVQKHSKSSQKIVSGLSYLYMWEIVPHARSKAPSSLKAEFSVMYKLNDKDDNKLYQYFFDINDYQTLYLLDATIEPAKGNEFCRVGIVCHLNLTIEALEQPSSSSSSNDLARTVMYEVLAEQSVWAVCGRTAGIVSFGCEERCQTVILDVMPLTSGYLPLPLVRISKYIPAETGNNEKSNKGDTHPRLEPFSPGQVYNKGKGKQWHVIASASESFQ